ncbi:hypothetical protein [Scatolibacter rhodanostii]|uniref:hypothetical protein n=1 Tax=Scatolibacter rhodanostii TaxID=2014781 RepID=UPI000C0788C9|nr:hypothetical protein [Scatolibacter rhodanostii]
MAEEKQVYDFSKFGASVGSAARQIHPQVEEREPEKKQPEVVKLPKKGLEKNRRPKLSPVKMFFYSISFAVVITVLSLTIYSQVQLTELTEQISQESYELEKAQALEVELGIKMAEKLNSAKVEQYAREELGMTKMNDSQVVYVNMVHEDKGEVLQDTEDSFFLKIWEEIKSWFA